MPPSNEISQTERLSQIAELVLRNTTVSIQDLVEMFQVSKMTVHRDLDELEQQGILHKVRGGATAQPSFLFESHLNYRINAAKKEKEAIAAAAIAHVEPGEAVMMDDSTTTLPLVRRLVTISHLTMITNFLTTIDILRPYRQIHLIGLGGDYLYRYNAFVGDLCEQMISSLRVNTLFLSTSAFDNGSLFHQDETIVRVKRAMIKSASRRILLIDHTKLGKQALRQVAPVSDLDLIIIDSGVDSTQLKILREHNVPIEIAQVTP